MAAARRALLRPRSLPARLPAPPCRGYVAVRVSPSSPLPWSSSSHSMSPLFVRHHSTAIATATTPPGDHGGDGASPANARVYAQLFDACDVDNNGLVTMPELKQTLFRFGLGGLGKTTLGKVFDTCDADRDGSLDLDNFAKFVEDSAELKTAFDAKLLEGSSPLWAQTRRELSRYRTSFFLLGEQTRGAAAVLCSRGWRLKRKEAALVWVAIVDFAKVLPFAVLIVSPGGSVLVPLVARLAPFCLPSTFFDGPRSTLQVVARILTLEKQLKVMKVMKGAARDSKRKPHRQRPSWPG